MYKAFINTTKLILSGIQSGSVRINPRGGRDVEAR